MADPLQPPSRVSQTFSLSNQGVLGIIAGGGNLPKQVIKFCQENNYPFYVIAIEGQTDSDTPQQTLHDWIKAGAVGEGIKRLRQNKVRNLIMVGYYKRPTWRELRPDLVGARWMAKFITKLGKDDGILRLVIQEFEKEGFHVIGLEELIGNEILVSEGVLGKHHPKQEDWVSINRGIEVLSVLGTVDVGQSIVTQEGCVIGIEGIEGTDRLMERCQGLYPGGTGGILVKMVKPYQDRRVDLPVVGLKTIETAIRSGIKGIAVQAGGVILLDKDKVLKTIDENGLFLVGVSR